MVTHVVRKAAQGLGVGGGSKLHPLSARSLPCISAGGSAVPLLRNGRQTPVLPKGARLAEISNTRVFLLGHLSPLYLEIKLLLAGQAWGQTHTNPVQQSRPSRGNTAGVQGTATGECSRVCFEVPVVDGFDQLLSDLDDLLLPG